MIQQLLNFRTSILVFWYFDLHLKVILMEKWLHLFVSLINFLVFILYLWGSWIAFPAEGDPNHFLLFIRIIYLSSSAYTVGELAAFFYNF